MFAAKDNGFWRSPNAILFIIAMAAQTFKMGKNHALFRKLLLECFKICISFGGHCSLFFQKHYLIPVG